MRGLVLDENARRDWLRLIRSENVGPATFWKLINRFGGAAAALDYLSSGGRPGRNRQPLRLYSAEQAEREMAQARRMGARLIGRSEPDYPGWLNHIHGAPPLLYVMGETGLLRRPVIAIAGSRNASAIGLRLTGRIAADLGAAGFVIVSGLARGIDAAAHEAALATGTIAVLAGGLDVIYPPGNRELYRRIARQGVLVSEMPPGTEPRARHFPRRNRLISGMSRAVLIVEAARRSGSLITARYAREQDRDVFAIPGSPADPRAEGTNDLIHTGAVLTRSAADILETLQFMTNDTGAPPGAFIEAEPEFEEQALPVADSLALQARLLDLLSITPVDIDDLIRQCGEPAARVNSLLLEMELDGLVCSHPGHCVALAPSSS